MRIKARGDTERLSYVILAVSIITGILTSVLMLKIDSIVHVTLYDYGLQFSPEWANPYWVAARMIYVLLTMPMILSIIVVVLKIVRSRKQGTALFPKSKETSTTETFQSSSRLPGLEIGTAVQEDVLLSVSYNSEPEQRQNTEAKSKVSEGSELLISCPHCSKVFNRPLVMLDFSSGNAHLVNICPYCNHNL